MLMAGKKIDWDEFDRANNRQTSHHEAGHAAIEFLFGQGSRIEHIHMKGDDEFAGRVRTARRFDWDNLFRLPWEKMNAADRQYQRGFAYREILNDLAGPAAEHKIDNDPMYEDFLFELSEEGQYSEPGSDLYRAYEMAMRIGGTERRAWVILRRVAAWADELMAIPRVWGTITALASKLGHGVTMSGEDACRIMRKAWGNDSGLPIRSFGRKWTRRFTVQQTRGR